MSLCGCVCLLDLSVRKRFLEPKHPCPTTWWFTVLVVWWNINYPSPLSFLRNSDGEFRSPPKSSESWKFRYGPIILGESLQDCVALVLALNVPNCWLYEFSGGKVWHSRHPETQTLTLTTTTAIPHSSLGLRPNITQKAMWGMEKRWIH